MALYFAGFYASIQHCPQLFHRNPQPNHRKLARDISYKCLNSLLELISANLKLGKK
jgi:hypothetical protein